MIAIAITIAFCFFASSLCITLVLATFLSILADPLVSFFERWHVPRGVSAGTLIVLGMFALGLLAYGSYNRISFLAETFPSYAERIREIVEPLNQKITRMEETAGRLNPEPPKKATEVRVKQPPTWPSYLVRGLGSASSAILVVGVVPFLTFFMLIRKDKWYQALALVLGPHNDPAEFSSSLALIVRRFMVGNLLVGLFLAGVTVCLLLALKIQGAVILGAVSGFLNLIPFLGVALAALVPAAAAFVQGAPLSTLLAIASAVIFFHVLASNILIPRFIGSRMNIGPVAATAGILFWGWLWGIVGVLLAIPLTGVIKLLADRLPALHFVSDVLGDSSQPHINAVIVNNGIAPPPEVASDIFK